MTAADTAPHVGMLESASTASPINSMSNTSLVFQLGSNHGREFGSTLPCVPVVSRCQRTALDVTTTRRDLFPALSHARAVATGGLLAVMRPAHSLAVRRVQLRAARPDRSPVVDVFRRLRATGYRAVRVCRQVCGSERAPLGRRVERITGHISRS